MIREDAGPLAEAGTRNCGEHLAGSGIREGGPQEDGSPRELGTCWRSLSKEDKQRGDGGDGGRVRKRKTK